MPIKVAIVEDDAVIREGLVFLFRSSPRFECLVPCQSAEAALAALPPLDPDVLLLDIHLPGISGIEFLPRFKALSPATQICMLTVFEDADAVFGALRAGATGYLLKATPPAAVLEAVQDLHAGGSPMSGQIARKLVTEFARQPSTFHTPPQPAHQASSPELCKREREILDLLAKGHRYKEIADELGISIHTVRSFIRSMYEKLQVHSRTEALLKVRGE
jgi:DNA-binding NarL/FixJ family response regulator